MSVPNGAYTRDFTGDHLATGQAGAKAIPNFFRQPVKNEKKSLDAGREIFDTVEMVTLIIPGDQHNIPMMKVSDKHRRLYAREYEAFLREEKLTEGGMPVEHWGHLSVGQAMSLKRAEIYTVEQIAQLSDEQLQRLGMGAHQLRRTAQAYIETAKTGAVPAKIIAENEHLRNQQALLVQQMAELSQRLESALKASGKDVSTIADPMVETRRRRQQTVATSSGTRVDIPDTYRMLGLSKLREIAGKITDVPVLNKDSAIEIIEEYLGKRDAAGG